MLCFVKSQYFWRTKGKLAEVTGVLAENNIDMWAISIADTTNFGILRIIVDEPEKAVEVLKDAGYPVNTTEVLAVEVSDRPGGLHQVLNILSNEDISIEYLYSFVRRPEEMALILFKVDRLNDATDILKRAGINVITNDQVYDL